MRKGRRIENFNPVENENSVRQETGRQFSSTAMSSADEGSPEIAKQMPSRAVWIKTATAFGPGCLLARIKRF